MPRACNESLDPEFRKRTNFKSASRLTTTSKSAWRWLQESEALAGREQLLFPLRGEDSSLGACPPSPCGVGLNGLLFGVAFSHDESSQPMLSSQPSFARGSLEHGPVESCLVSCAVLGPCYFQLYHLQERSGSIPCFLYAWLRAFTDHVQLSLSLLSHLIVGFRCARAQGGLFFARWRQRQNCTDGRWPFHRVVNDRVEGFAVLAEVLRSSCWRLSRCSEY